MLLAQEGYLWTRLLRSAIGSGTFTQKIRARRIFSLNEYFSSPFNKCGIIHVGWGRTIGGGKPANILQQAVMPVVDHQTCAKANSDLVPVDDQSMLCAGYATAGNVISGCQGDSGGPFVCEENERFVLHGAVSWGHPRCEADSSYTVFARVSSYVDWINDKMAIGGLVYS